MRARLEETSVRYRGVVLTSETDEEKRVLWSMWAAQCGPVSVGKLDDGSIELVVAPSAEEEK